MTTPLDRRISVADRIKSYLPYTQARPEYVAEGRLLRMVGLTLEAVGCKVPIGGHCTIRSPEAEDIEAEVVGFSDQKMYLMPIEPVSGVQPGARVIPNRHVARIPVGDGLLGRILDGRGQPLDRKGPLQITEYAPLHREAINPLERKPIDEPLDVGVRAINSVLTVGRGQRMGLFAGSGVGKSVLLGMMTRFTSADITV
ncbi:MAG: flagellum-specific ATP synthase FliI, partial [Pseudomonadota bacterium]